MACLSVDETRAFYDRFGASQDRQAFYEDAALDRLVDEGAFRSARRVFELGCGTGRFAERLLAEVLPAQATYVGVDISETMLRLARERLGRWGPRARVEPTDGSFPLPYPDGSFDRFVATYVLDLLAEDDVRRALVEAQRLLEPGGRLAVAGLTEGIDWRSRLVARLWAAVHRLRPQWVGGCRPLVVSSFLSADAWSLLHREVVVRWGIPSEVLVAERR